MLPSDLILTTSSGTVLGFASAAAGVAGSNAHMAEVSQPGHEGKISQVSSYYYYYLL